MKKRMFKVSALITVAVCTISTIAFAAIDNNNLLNSSPADSASWDEDNDLLLYSGSDPSWDEDNDLLLLGDSSEYILPGSSTSLLTNSDLEGLSADQIQMAINEIYARHHRKFVTKSIQDYFNSKTWYEGTVEASSFDETSLNQYENQNIALMIQYRKNMTTNINNIAGTSSLLCATATVNIRSKATTNSVIMGIVPQGCSVTVTGTPSKGWVPVSYNGIRGYVSQDYLTDAVSNSSSSTASNLAASNSSPANTGATSSSSTATGTSSGSTASTDTGSTSSVPKDTFSGCETSSDTNAVSAAVQLYTGYYRDSSIFTSEDGWSDYYALAISNITDTSFDFTLYLMDGPTDVIKETMFATNTAVFTGDGTTAYYDGKQYDLTFSFPDYHNALPQVTDIQISGFWASEGITFANNGIPGHEFS